MPPLQVRMRALTSKTKFIRTESLIKDVTREFERLEDELMQKAQYYPPYEGSNYTSYIRTYTLYEGWKSRISNTWSALALTIWNNVYYAKWVQGKEQQPIFKWIGWYRIAEEMEKIRRSYRDRIQKIVKKNLEV